MPEGGYKPTLLASLFEAFTGNFDIQANHLTDSGVYVISAGVSNNGIIGKTNIPCRVIENPSLTVDMFGHVFFQPFPVKLVTHARVFALIPKFFATNEDCIYLAALISKLCETKFSYSSMASWNKIKDLSILLPYNSFGDIDFEYMRLHIRKLEEERMHELDVFLQGEGLEDCTLTKQENESVDLIETGKIEMKTMRIVDEVFNVKNSHNILKSDVVFGSGSVPYVTASEGNNSIVSYISYNDDAKEEGNTILIGGKTLVITYQPQAFFSNDSHNLVLSVLNNDAREENVQLYLVASLYKSLSHKYSWGNSISKQKIQSDTIDLPIMANGEIDYQLMATYIRAVKKQCIARLKEEINRE